MADSEQMTLKYQQLLRDLKTTVEGLLNSQVANVWQIYGGLNRLHVDVEKVFKHGCKCCSNNILDSNYWQFVQGLEWLHPDTTNSTFIVDCEYKPHIPQNIKTDRASIWLYRTLENHSLSQKLSWLLSDKTHLSSCYQSTAFLCQPNYAEATLICLRAVERNQPSLISEIKPGLFIINPNAREFYKMHRRCSSFPDSHLKTIREPARVKSGQSFESGLKKCDEMPTAPARVIMGKLRAWNSTPNLRPSYKLRNRSNTMVPSRTTPSTPSHTKKLDDVPTNVLAVDYDSLQRSTQKVRPLKRLDWSTRRINHVKIDDIVEHTPSASCSKLKLVDPKSPGSSVQDVGFLSSLSGIAGEKDFKRKPKKTFIEDGGMSVLPMATGYFPRPRKGQSLTSFLMSSNFSRTNAELDRENAHFNISEAVISAMEQIKCRGHVDTIEEHQEDTDDEIKDLKQRIRVRRRQKFEEKQRKVFGSLTSSERTDTTTTEASPVSFSSSPGTFSASISSEEVDDMEIDEASTLTDNRDVSLSMASLYSSDLLNHPRGAPDGASDILSAESVALSLISKFTDKQLPRASELEWLVSEKEVNQALLPLPKSWPVNPDDCDEAPITPLRGTREWAPPRPQIIFTLHPVPSRKDLMSRQNYRCAGCGMRVAEQYASKFRYCNYLGRYFCTGCHTNQLAIIPARAIQKWNFTRYPVSTFSYRLLEQMYSDALFRVFDLNKNIAKLSKNLQVCQKYRQGLSYLKDYILSCRLAETIQDFLNSEQTYIFNDPGIYSMEDLVNVRSGEMKARLQYIVEVCCRHTGECELCKGRGFYCQICNSDDLLYPWQMRTARRCPQCGCCFHAKCWQPDEPCRRCARIKRRQSTSN